MKTIQALACGLALSALLTGCKAETGTGMENPGSGTTPVGTAGTGIAGTSTTATGSTPSAATTGQAAAPK